MSDTPLTASRPAAPLSLALGRFKQLPQRSTEVWQGMAMRLPAWIDSPDDAAPTPYRPWMILWVSMRTGLIHPGLSPDRGGWTPDLALSSLLEFGARWGRQLDGRPARVEVTDPRLRDAIAPALSGVNTPVVLVDEVPAVKAAYAELEAQMTGGRLIPGALEGAGMTVDRLRSFAEAGAAFYRAKPWIHLANEDLIVVESPKASKSLSHISVLGNGGQEFGLGFFESRRAFDSMIETGVPKRGIYGVTFGPIDELPFADGDAWEENALPVAGPQAYPMASRVTLEGVVTRPKAAEVAFIEALLRALADTTEKDLDAGRWTRRVETANGPIELTLTLPDMLASAAGTDREGDASASPSAAERAQGLAYRAMDASGRVRLKLAREALALDEDCVDAWIILGHAEADSSRAIERFERAVAAAVRTIGPEAFQEMAGEFWGHVETRPYMRARQALADALVDVGRTDEGVDHFQDMLRLNPNDNQGIRYLLLALLLRLRRDDEAAALTDRYPKERKETWPYGLALLAYRRGGDSAASRRALSAAHAANPHVARFLAAPEEMPFDFPGFSGIGSEDEAAFIAEELCPAFDQTAGARAWVARHTAGRSAARGRRDRRRPRR